MNGRHVNAIMMAQWCILRGYKEKEEPWVSVSVSVMGICNEGLYLPSPGKKSIASKTMF